MAFREVRKCHLPHFCGLIQPTKDVVDPFHVVFFVGLIGFVCRPTNAFGDRFQRSSLGAAQRQKDWRLQLRFAALTMPRCNRDEGDDIGQRVIVLSEFEPRVETFVRLMG